MIYFILIALFVAICLYLLYRHESNNTVDNDYVPISNVSSKEPATKNPEKILGDHFDKAVMDAADSSGGNPMIAGVLIYSAIAQTYDSLKHNNSLIQKCGLTDSEYLQLLEKVLNEKGREYINNWDQMRGSPNMDYEDRYIDMDF